MVCFIAHQNPTHLIVVEIAIPVSRPKISQRMAVPMWMPILKDLLRWQSTQRQCIRWTWKNIKSATGRTCNTSLHDYFRPHPQQRVLRFAWRKNDIPTPKTSSSATKKHLATAHLAMDPTRMCMRFSRRTLALVKRYLVMRSFSTVTRSLPFT